MKKILLLLLGVGLLAAKDDARPKKPKPRFPIGKETTYVTEPRDADGYIDYAAALNEHWRRGVTPENNANVLLWKAFGPHPEGVSMPDECNRSRAGGDRCIVPEDYGIGKRV